MASTGVCLPGTATERVPAYRVCACEPPPQTRRGQAGASQGGGICILMSRCGSAEGWGWTAERMPPAFITSREGVYSEPPQGFGSLFPGLGSRVPAGAPSRAGTEGSSEPLTILL